jgi:hypothetical protein
MHQTATRCALVALCLGISLCAGSIALGQGINTASPTLPPDHGVYLTPDQVHATYHGPGLVVVLSQIQHQPFAPGVITPLGVGNEQEDFNSALTGLISVNGSPDQPVAMTGPVTVESFGKTGNTTGTFNTEMLSMNLSGGAMVRESPSLPSLDQTRMALRVGA